MNRPLVLASGNQGKLAELRRALTPLQLTLAPLSDWTAESPVEDGDSFLANALIKARHAARITGLACLADDSGLEVSALDGAPGIRSARYAGESADDAANNDKLLAALAGVPAGRRQARFRCVIALVREAGDPAPLVAEGAWSGEILTAPRGTAGFGYDPLFLDPSSGLSAAEMPADDKLARSHRGAAIRDLIAQIRGGALAP